jgi:class 3 adenylate cyclase
MAQSLLRTVLGKKGELHSLLEQMGAAQQFDFSVTESTGKLLFGPKIEQAACIVPVKGDDETLGLVSGHDPRVNQVAILLQWLCTKEADRKKLGSEVLALYQELNVIYNFTEKLANIIEPDAIARLALEQAMHSISAQGGIVLLWDSEHMLLKVAGMLGASLFNEILMPNELGLLMRIGLNGQSEIMDDLQILKEKGLVEMETQSLMYATLKGKQRIQGAILLASKEADFFKAGHLKLLVTLALQSSSAIEAANLFERNIREIKKREEAILRINEVIRKFVPYEFISSLGYEDIIDIKLGDQVERIVTVLFTDIRDFTTLSEQMTPEENFKFVSSFNARLGPIIRSHNGFINQYLGDSIMAIFPGEPVEALNAGIAMQQEIEALNRERETEGLPLIQAGIGMHTGPLIMGITGDDYRLDAATISDTVNTSSRIESLTKHYKANLLLSGETLRYIPNTDRYAFRQLGKVLLKGKNNQMDIIECLNGQAPDIQSRRESALPLFHDAIRHFQQQQFVLATQCFEKILASDPQDHTSVVFLERAYHYAQFGVPANWTGAVEMMTK